VTEFADPTRVRTESGPDSGTETAPVQAAKQGAADVASTVGEGAKETAGEVVTQAKAVAGEARDQLSTMFDQTRSELAQQADARTKQAAGGLRTLAGQVEALADGRPQDAGPLAGVLADARSRVSTMADRLESAGPQGVIDDVSSFARRRPLVFLAVAAGAGFAAGRLARAGKAAAQDGPSSTGTTARALPAPPAGVVPTSVAATTAAPTPPVAERVP
jgi:hypothetical protein